MKVSRRLLGVVAASALTMVAVAGCTVNINAPQVPSQSETTDFSGMDIMFAQMMIPHHQQAVDMSTLAETNTSNTVILELAAQIKAAQAPEIEQMQGWIESQNASMDMGHDMGMGGMLTDEQMQALIAAKDEEFDRLYLEGMIEHHRGAIQMTSMIQNSTNAEAKALAEAIITSQTAEIEYMQGLLK